MRCDYFSDCTSTYGEINLEKCFLMGVFVPADRPWLTEGQKVQKLQEKVYLALQHSLQKSSASDEKLDKVSNRSLTLEASVRDVGF